MLMFFSHSGPSNLMITSRPRLPVIKPVTRAHGVIEISVDSIARKSISLLLSIFLRQYTKVRLGIDFNYHNSEWEVIRIRADDFFFL